MVAIDNTAYVPPADMAGTDTAAILNSTPDPVPTMDESPNEAGVTVSSG